MLKKQPKSWHPKVSTGILTLLVVKSVPWPFPSYSSDRHFNHRRQSHPKTNKFAKKFV